MTTDNPRATLALAFQAPTTGRADRREQSIAANWNDRTEAERAAIANAEAQGLTLSPGATLRAGFIDTAHAAHDRIQEGN